MSTKLIYALTFTIFLVTIPIIGVGILKLEFLFSIVVPYLALAIFFLGSIHRVVLWSTSPQPFNITLSAGQNKSFRWIRTSYVESPHSKFGVILRMITEVLLFRSLLRNERVKTHESRWLVFTPKKGLWFLAMIFHYSLLVIVLKHLRFFFEPTPFFLDLILRIDKFFELSLPSLSLTEVLVLVGTVGLLLRRILSKEIKYISLFGDYFILLLILTLVLTGILLKHSFRVDLLDVKRFCIGLFTFNPHVPSKVGLTFYVHLFFVSVLLVYFPYSKLVHAKGVFFSPTRNLPNNSRQKRYINPWNYPVKVKSYEEWEEEYRDMLKEANIPLDKEEKGP
ncbi:MAG: sulfate reduction electron transfer complex DsrMKJOP subunit DsrM [Deltaproteobacteria bacterium]|nr:sulfate reduction electron transfer complex DsrMKJOP subunit DsrM [Deltaproteobacteria bacterium]